MHIVFLTHEYPPAEHGGIGTFSRTLARGLVARGHFVTVVGHYPIKVIKFEDDKGVRVIRLPGSRIYKSGFFFNSYHLRKALKGIQRQRKIDLIEGPNLSLAQISQNIKAPKILRIHSTISLDKKPKIFRSWLIRKSFNVANHICAVSDFCARSNQKNIGIEKKIEIIFNPADTSIFYPRPNTITDQGNILFVGTVCENKGVRQLIQAMPEIIQKVPQAKLLIVGRDWPDKKTGISFTETMRNEMPSEIKGHIQFNGPVNHSEIPELISKCQVCVFPSHLENMPVAWLETMAMGKSIIASKTGPGPEIIVDGISGLLCDPFDPSSIAKHVIKVLGSKKLRKELGAEAKKRFERKFSMDVILEQNEKYYRQCINQYISQGH